MMIKKTVILFLYKIEKLCQIIVSGFVYRSYPSIKNPWVFINFFDFREGRLKVGTF